MTHSAWLEAPIQRMYDDQARYEAACEAYDESEDFMPHLIEWLIEQLKDLGRIPLNTEECDCSLKQEVIDTIVGAYRDSSRYEEMVGTRMDAEDMIDVDDPMWNEDDDVEQQVNDYVRQAQGGDPDDARDRMIEDEMRYDYGPQFGEEE